MDGPLEIREPQRESELCGSNCQRTPEPTVAAEDEQAARHADLRASCEIVQIVRRSEGEHSRRIGGAAECR